MVLKIPKTLKDLNQLVKAGEGPSLEFKRSTGELKEGLQTLCGFLNADGGVLLFGVRNEGGIEGQQVTDQTMRDVAQALDRFEPSAHPAIHRVRLKNGRGVIALAVERTVDKAPYTFEGRAYERVGSTTRRMPQARYEKLLFERSHATRRWEKYPTDLEPGDIDRKELFRIASAARTAGRLVEPAGSKVPIALDRFGVREGGKILQAAVVLFGKKFMPDYPQCEIRMARFNGTDKTEFMDQKMLRGPAFRLLEEAELFCQRHFPLPGKVVPWQLERVDRPLIPPDAMREILVNALIHRDYTIAGGAVSLAIFDDRVEVWSAGSLPKGITAEDLSKEHTSVQRNPTIADVFHRAGLIEKWGRGTNRVIDMCKKAGIQPPTFREITGATVVTFRVPVRQTEHVTAHDTEHVTAHDTEHVTAHDTEHVQMLLKAALAPKSRDELQDIVGIKHREHFRATYLQPLIKDGLLELTLPGKLKSIHQKYRTTAKGRQVLKEK